MDVYGRFVLRNLSIPDICMCAPPVELRVADGANVQFTLESNSNITCFKRCQLLA
jgi:hypothetical protein